MFFVGPELADLFFVGPENVPLATCSIYPLTLLCCRAIYNKNYLNSYAICARNPGMGTQRTHFRAPQSWSPSSCKSDLHFHTCFTPSLIASLQQLFALFLRFPSSCCHMFAFQICIYNLFHSSHWRKLLLLWDASILNRLVLLQNVPDEHVAEVEPDGGPAEELKVQRGTGVIW